jgi:ABC-type long-subunit fatty acid transport system fused permease/ATPase subunit
MTNRQHFLHRTLDVGSGFILALCVQTLVFPLFGIDLIVLEQLQIALIFTVIGILRSYIWSKYIFKYR